MDCLDRLAQLLECEFVSDLRCVLPTGLWIQRVRQMPATTFTVREYQEILSYMGDGGQTACTSQAESKERLLNLLCSCGGSTSSR